MSEVEYKTYENRIRRVADRQGLKLEKSRSRDPRATEHGTYRLYDPATNTVVSHNPPGGYGLSLTDVDRELSKGIIGYAAAADYYDYDNEAEARGELD